VSEALDALAHPRYVMAVGACALSGGPFRTDLGGWCGPVDASAGVPVDVYVPGCPPRPEAILDGIERLRARIAEEAIDERWGRAAVRVPRSSGGTPPPAAPAAPLHRGVERVVERLAWSQVGPVLCRLDEAGTIARSVAFARAFETLVAHAPPPSIERARDLLVDLAVLRHVTGWFVRLARLLGLDVVEASSWRARETVLDAFEHLTGARIHVDAVRPGHADLDLSPAANAAVGKAAGEAWAWTQSLDRLLFGVGVVEAELRGLASVDHDAAVAFGLSGPNGRASASEAVAVDGIAATHTAGDAWARAWVRAQDARSACQAVLAWSQAPPTGGDLTGTPLGYPRAGIADAHVAHPEGDLLCTLVSNGRERPWRVRVNGPGMAARSISAHVIAREDLDGSGRDLAQLSFAVDPAGTDR
jgi:Ni,Fe-hydrogenase III large subunit